jgi:nucleoside-diphosphate-sugar epimerase
MAEVDLRDSGKMKSLLTGVECVFHLAAAHLDVLKGQEYFYDVNVDASARLAEMAHEQGAQRFIHCSSVSVYGPLSAWPVDENSPCEPDIAYEQSKLSGENAIRQAAGRTGLRTVIIRPAWVYGPRCPRTEKLIRSIRRRRFFFVGRGKNKRHPIYVADLIDAFNRAVDRELEQCETFIIAGPEVVSVRQLADAIAAELGIQSRIPTLPKALVWAGCLALESAGKILGREPPFSRRSLKFFTENSSFDTARAKNRLDFTPQISLRDGLHATLDYYRRTDALP